MAVIPEAIKYVVVIYKPSLFVAVTPEAIKYVAVFHSVFSSYLLTKHISSAIMGWLLIFNPKWKDFAMGNFFYWANIAHWLYLSTSYVCETNFTK